MIGVAGRDGVDAMADFVDRHDLGDLDHLVDDDGALWASFGVVTQPSWVFINDDGTVSGTVGILGSDGLNEAMDALAAA